MEEHRDSTERTVVSYLMVSIVALLVAIVSFNNENWVCAAIAIAIVLVAGYISHRAVTLLEAITTVEEYVTEEQAEKINELYRKEK